MVVLCYNQEDFIEESIVSCLAQDYENLEIIISDDNSTDNTFTKIKAILSNQETKHKIILNKNQENMGIGNHFKHIMQNFVTGELAVMCAGDDKFHPNRVARITEEWIANHHPSLVAHSVAEINENGLETYNIREFIYRKYNHKTHLISEYALLEYSKHLYYLPYIGAAVAYDMNTYKAFPAPQIAIDTEDHLMYFRALLKNGVHFFDEKLTYYRIHTNSYTQKQIKPLTIKNDNIAEIYADKYNTLKTEYINTYGLMKTRIQQWLDYLYAIQNLNTKLNFEVASNLYNTITREHNILIRNKNLLHNIIAHCWHIKQKIHPQHTKKPITKINFIPKIKTVIFGTGRGAKNVMGKLSDGFEIIYACNTLDDKSERFNGLKVIDLKQLSELKDEYDCILIASSKYYHIKKMLIEEASIEQNKIVRIPALTISK